MSKRWYVVHAYSGFEKSVQRALEDRISRAGMQDKFGRILVPVEEVVEMKGGQKHMSERKFFPGYVLVEMEMNDDTWHLVKNTNKVTGFVGDLPAQEIEQASAADLAAAQDHRAGAQVAFHLFQGLPHRIGGVLFHFHVNAPSFSSWTVPKDEISAVCGSSA